MSDYLLGNQTIQLRPSEVIGKGGEADIYRRGGEPYAYKIFKTPSHPDLAGQIQLQREAEARIAEHQKKLPAFPRNLPSRVSSPRELIRDKKGLIAGYQMDFIDNVEVLLRYGERNFRDQGVSDATVCSIFIDLYKTVEAVHRAHVVIGDFNDLNILVKGERAHLIDADSMQFGNFPARMFTAKFVDPLICDPNATLPLMVGKHDSDTDWYAYLVMLMQSLLFVGPYGGVYRPQDTKKSIPHDARALKRITVFNSEVRYPKPSRPYKILPDDLLGYLMQVFEKDKRGQPPLSLIENLRFTTCTKCGAKHARIQCPDCIGVTPPMVKEVHTGKAKAKKVFETGGQILFATMQGENLRYLYHDQDTYWREGNQKVVRATLEPNVRFRINGNRTLFGQGTSCLVFGPFEPEGKQLFVDAFGPLPLIDANERSIFASQNGVLNRIGALGLEYPERVGDVLQNQTLFWTGEDVGFGFYRAADLSMYFIFRSARQGINDSVKLPQIRGQLIDATCYFGHERIWFLTATQEGGRTIHRSYLLTTQGELLASSEASPGDGTWLGHIRGACAAGPFLFVPTDDGVQRIVQHGQTLVVGSEFPDTSRFVDTDSLLFINKSGLHVVQRHDIWQITVG